ncbi:MAG TPA: CARDB domain-containing protein, partial [Thermoleophilaceae bacterium]
VKLLSCSQAAQSAVFRGRMTRVPGADQMALRYTLLSRLPASSGEKRVRVPGLGRWHRSKPGVGTFAFKQEMLNLAAGGTYRVRVDFRWFDETGALVKSTKRRSPACAQLARLPNLRIEIVGAQPTKTDGIWRYWLRVGNDGLALASNIGVKLSLDGTVASTQTVPLLDAGGWNRLTVRAPACERWADAEVDPGAAIAESNELDNRQQSACSDLLAG